ncbi:cupredoxin domain-containing protein [Paenibacillus glycanilyticus]|uniref:Blue (type 1) copper domain-containing protein n=1 Tax=Paenibacillus glycanilyticus TaxID=126569 RepID=A0ABQ6GBJ5_9BACL|nr:cupredoxin family copper-binding protein [Paenibacillus glycanilyticus]GLX68329.1 hypothetical protein MU1_26740 [Paenibacillus glycanilyticus]
MRFITNRRLLLPLAGVLFVWVLAACGNSTGNSGNSGNSASPTPEEVATAAASQEHEQHESAAPSAAPEASPTTAPEASSTAKPQATAKPSPNPSPSPSHDDHHGGHSNDDDSKASPAVSQKPPKSTPSAAATSAASEDGGKEYVVEISNFAFAPAKLEIKAGDRVKFINKDAIKHSATADDGSFDTGLLAENEDETVTFDKAGEFALHCTPHPGMKATIVVSDQ